MQIQQNISLKPYNTFSIDASARYFSSFSTIDELIEVLAYKPSNEILPLFILGGGSNILLTQNYNGIVVKNEMRGIELVKEDSAHYYIKAAAGENWHQFVLHCIKNNYAGVENLSLIPGNIGASPMQNIGAYGVEIKDVFYELEAINTNDKSFRKFTASECEFGYRESVFKRKEKGKYVITSVTFRLNKKPVFNTAYGAIQQELEKMKVKKVSIAAVSQAVINIRESKLPDPKVIGNAGSFFKNPTIKTEQFEKLQQQFPGIIGYKISEKETKIAAGWLIEQCGWKGYRKDDAGVHAQQALVLINYGNSNGLNIYQLSTEIMNSVEKKFKILLEREVNVV